MSGPASTSVDFIRYAQYGTTGVILATLVLCAYLIVSKRRPSDRQLLAFFGFFVVAILFSFWTQFHSTGPWVFIGTVQNSTRQLYPDNSKLFAFSRTDDQLLTTEYIFYVSHEEIKDGSGLPFLLLEPQPGDHPKHFAWVCFTREPNSYSERPLGSGDVQLVPNGSLHAPCGPPAAAGSALGFVSTANAGILMSPPAKKQADVMPIELTYTTTDVFGLCKWNSASPPITGNTLVICDQNALTTDDPGTKELKTYITALQNEQTDTSTKISVLKKFSALSSSQQQALAKLSPSAAYCENERAYPDEGYVEPIALTLFDLARSSDVQVSGLARQAIDKLQAQSAFADFVFNGAPECRNEWLLRIETNQATSLLDTLKSKGLPAAELEALSPRTPDAWRTIIRPTATSNGDLYRVVAKIPSEDTKLKCLARVYRLVNMQNGTAVSDPSDAIAKEVQLLKRIANQSRTVGWYSKIFQRDLLVGAHQCEVEAVSTH